MLAALRNKDDDRPALFVAGPQDRTELAAQLRASQQRIHFQSGGQAIHVQIARCQRLTPGSGSVAFIGIEQHRCHCIAATRAAQLFDGRSMTDQPADRCKRLQMFGARIGR